MNANDAIKMNDKLPKANPVSSEIGFTKECPTIAEKRKKAIAYLGNRHILHPATTYSGNWMQH